MNAKLTSRYWWWVSLVLAILIALLFTLRVEASDFRSGDHVVIEKSEVIEDDLFVGGQTVEINGHVMGDLLAGGTKVIVNGTVDGSLFAGGQEVIINGNVKGSTYAGGMAVTLGEEADIGRNFYGGAFHYGMEHGSVVERNVYVGGYQAAIAGAIGRDLVVDLGALDMTGSVGRDLTGQIEVDPSADSAPNPGLFMPVDIPNVESGLNVAESAEVGGRFDVTETILTATATPAETDSWGRWAFLRERLGEYIALLLVGALALYFMPPFVERVEEQLAEETALSFVWGMVVAVAFPVLLFIVAAIAIVTAIVMSWIAFGALSATIIGLGGTAIAFAVVGFTFVATVVTKVLVALLAGRYLVSLVLPSTQPTWQLQFGALAIGAFLYELLRMIPYVGWLIVLAVVFTGLGAIYLAWRHDYGLTSIEKAPVVATPVG